MWVWACRFSYAELRCCWFLCFGFWNIRHIKMKLENETALWDYETARNWAICILTPLPPEIQQPSSTCSTRNSTDKLEDPVTFTRNATFPLNPNAPMKKDSCVYDHPHVHSHASCSWACSPIIFLGMIIHTHNAHIEHVLSLALAPQFLQVVSHEWYDRVVSCFFAFLSYRVSPFRSLIGQVVASFFFLASMRTQS
jgi:hypothetical protein